MDPAEMREKYASLQAQVDQMPSDELWRQNNVNELNLPKAVRVLDLKIDFQNEVTAMQNDVLFQIWQKLEKLENAPVAPSTKTVETPAVAPVRRKTAGGAVFQRSKSSESLTSISDEIRKEWTGYGEEHVAPLEQADDVDDGAIRSLTEFKQVQEAREKPLSRTGSMARMGSGWLWSTGGKKIRAKSLQLQQRMSVVCGVSSNVEPQTSRQSTNRPPTMKEKIKEATKLSKKPQSRISEIRKLSGKKSFNHVEWEADRSVHEQINAYLHRMSTTDQEVDEAVTDPILKTGARRWDDVPLPSHPFFAVWTNIMFISVAYVAVFVPLQAAFDEDLSKSSVVWFWINVVVDLIFIIDVILKFNTALKQQGRWVLERKAVVKEYLKGEFALDFVAAFPYALLVTSVTNDFPWNEHDGPDNTDNNLIVIRALRLVRLLRVVTKLMRNGTNVADVMSGGATRFNPQLVRVSQLLFMLVLTCHWLGCLWWLVGTVERKTTHPLGDTWGPDAWLRSQNLTTRYLHSFNWGAGMILSYVPYDVEPQEDAEVVVTFVAMFLGFFIGMFFISSTTSALQAQDARSALSQQKLEKINRYLEYKK
eukprot:6190750-Prymnesium_polylepis.1